MVHVLKHVEKDHGLNNDHAKTTPRQTNAVDQLRQLIMLQRSVIRMIVVRYKIINSSKSLYKQVFMITF